MESWETSEEANNAALFHNPNQDVRIAWGRFCVCLADDDGLKHIDSLLKP